MKRGLTGALGPDKGGRSLDFCERKKYYSPSLVVVGGVRAESLEGKPSTVPVTGRREEALHLFPEKQ